MPHKNDRINNRIQAGFYMGENTTLKKFYLDFRSHILVSFSQQEIVIQAVEDFLITPHMTMRSMGTFYPQGNK